MKSNGLRFVPVGIIFLSVSCFIIGCIAVFVPYWGSYRNRVVEETGHFGPWTLCKQIDPGRKMCGPKFVMFKPTFVVVAAGICAAVGVFSLGLQIIFSVIYFYFTIVTPSSDIKYIDGEGGIKLRTKRHYLSYVVIIMIILLFGSGLTATTSVGLFAMELGDSTDRGYLVESGTCFYLEIVVALFSIILLLLAVFEHYWIKSEQDRANNMDQQSGEKGGRSEDASHEDDVTSNNRDKLQPKWCDNCHMTGKCGKNLSNQNGCSCRGRDNNFSEVHRKSQSNRIGKGNSDRDLSSNNNTNTRLFHGKGRMSLKRKRSLGGSSSDLRLISSLLPRPYPSPSPGSARRGSGSKCNKFPDPLHFNCIADDDDDCKNKEKRESTKSLNRKRSPFPSPGSSRRGSGSKCTRFPEPLHYFCTDDEDDDW